MTKELDNIRRSFSSKRSMLALTCPRTRDYLEAWHETVTGFGVRVMAPDQDGRVRRTYICRYNLVVPDGKGGVIKKDKKEKIGLVEELDGESAITFDEALEIALSKRRVLKEQKKEGTSQRMTVGAAWELHGSEKRLNRPATLNKDTKTYERNLAYLKDKFLDELDYPFWSQFVTQIKNGTLQVGVQVYENEEVPDLRGPLANSSTIAVLNVASNLYEIAHKYKGIKKLEHKENPARDAKKLIGAPAKRQTQLALRDVGKAWRASGQLVVPGFRDMFRVYLLTGLRRSLLLSMKFSDINFKSGTFIIDPRTAGTKRRGKDMSENPEMIKIPLSNVVLQILKERREFAPDSDGTVWYSQPAKGVKSASGIMSEPRASWAHIEAQVNTPFSPHDLRRTFATLGSIVQGIDIFAVSLLMLHSGTSLAAAIALPAITVQYINTSESQGKMRIAANAISEYVISLANGTVKAPDNDPELPSLLSAAAASE